MVHIAGPVVDCIGYFDLESCSYTVSRLAARCRIAPVFAYCHSIQPRDLLQVRAGLSGQLSMLELDIYDFAELLDNEAAAWVDTVVRDSCAQGYYYSWDESRS